MGTVEGKSENSINEGENKNHNSFHIFIESGIYATKMFTSRSVWIVAFECGHKLETNWSGQWTHIKITE